MLSEEGLIYRSPRKAFGMYFLLVSVASLATCSYSACKFQIPGEFYLYGHSGFISSAMLSFMHGIPCAWKAPSTQTNKLSSSEAFKKFFKFSFSLPFLLPHTNAQNLNNYYKIMLLFFYVVYLTLILTIHYISF